MSFPLKLITHIKVVFHTCSTFFWIRERNNYFIRTFLLGGGKVLSAREQKCPNKTQGKISHTGAFLFSFNQQVPTLDFLSEKLAQYMAQYNEMVRGGSLDLVFFKDAMIHLVKVNMLF